MISKKPCKKNAFAAVILAYWEEQDNSRAESLVLANGKLFPRFAFDAPEVQHSSIEGFLIKELGPGSADLQRLRDLYLTLYFDRKMGDR